MAGGRDIATYPDGQEVPLYSEKCTSQYSPDSKAHVCRRKDEHKEVEHICICGLKWEFLDARK